MSTWAIKVGAGVLLVAALIAGYFAWASHQQRIGEAMAIAAYNVKIEAQKKEAAAVLAKETARVATAERTLQNFKNRQEVKDVRNKKTVDTLASLLRDLAGPAGRLRDPHADSGRGGGGSGSNGPDSAGTGNRPDNGSAPGGVLSAELTEFLQRLTIEADEINNAYISCRADAEAVRAR